MWKQYALYWLLFFILFGFVQDAGYVTDYLGWQTRVVEGGFLGAFHSYDYPAQLQGYAIMMWLIEELRSISTWLVHGLNVTLYVSCSFLLYQLVKQTLELHSANRANFAGQLAAGLFLLSPTNTEILIWRVCPHYLVSIIIWIGTLLLLKRYFGAKSNKPLWGALGLQLIGIFSLELAYALPIAIAGWACYLVFFNKTGSWRKALISFGTSTCLIVFHLLLTKAVQGTWIGHYGAEVATAQSFSEIIASPWRWIARAGVHYRFWSNELRFGVTKTIGEPIVSIMLYCAVLILLLKAVREWILQRNSDNTPPVWFALILWIFLAGAGTAAVSQLYYYDMLLVDTDRFGALTVLFTAAFIATLVSLSSIRASLFLGLVLISISGFLQWKTINNWAISQEILSSLSTSFSDVLAKAEQQGEHPEKVYLLGYARSYKGIHLLGDSRNNHSAFAGHLSSTVSEKQFNFNGDIKLIDISQFHQLDLLNKLNAEWGNERLYISLDAHGSWMTHNDLGITNRRNDMHGFRVLVEEYNIQIIWDTPPSSNTIFLYQINDKFVRLPYPLKGKSPEPLIN